MKKLCLVASTGMQKAKSDVAALLHYIHRASGRMIRISPASETPAMARSSLGRSESMRVLQNLLYSSSLLAIHSLSFASAFPLCETWFFSDFSISAYVRPSYSNAESHPATTASVITRYMAVEHKSTYQNSSGLAKARFCPG